MDGTRNPAPKAPSYVERVIRAHRFRVPRTREIPQATARPARAAWAHTRSAKPAKSVV